MLIIGIDPGKSGGVAWVDELGTTPLAEKMPDTVHELAELLRGIVAGHGAKCYVEKVASTPQMGVKSAFTFGNGLGHIEGVLAALQIPYEWISPLKWQGALSCKTGGDKNVSKRKALELFPGVRWSHSTADSALICEYGRRMELRGQA